jgi:hypothetical protein
MKVKNENTKVRSKMKGWKKVLRVFLIIALTIPIALIVIVGCLYLYADNKPDIHKGYNQQIKTGGEIESKYLQTGSYETKKTTIKAQKPIDKYTIYYPGELEKTAYQYPMILVVNGTGGKASKYEPEFDLYASWGFIVVGTQDKGTGSGKSTVTTLHYMLEQNENPDSVFYHKIDVDNIGITGFSQGGAAVINVLTKYDEKKYLKAAAPLSPVNDRTAEQMTDYPYDISKVECPIMILAGTNGKFETETVIPIEVMNSMYDKVTAPKIMARRIGMTHDQMMYSAGGYVIAWFRWLLQGDEYAAKAFTGDNPELLTSIMYQDQRINYKSVNEGE